MIFIDKDIVYTINGLDMQHNVSIFFGEFFKLPGVVWKPFLCIIINSIIYLKIYLSSHTLNVRIEIIVTK